MKIACHRAFALLSLAAVTGLASAGPSKMGGPAPMGKMGGGPGGPHMGGGHMGGQRMLEHMAKELGLSEAQKSKLKGMMESSMKQRRALHDSTTLTPDQKMAKMRAMRMQSMKQMQAVLTPPQRKKWAEMREKMMQHREERMDGKMGKKAM